MRLRSLRIAGLHGVCNCDDRLNTQNSHVKVELTWDELAATSLALDRLKALQRSGLEITWNGDDRIAVLCGIDTQVLWDSIYKRAYRILSPDPQDGRVSVARGRDV